ncbi:MAG: hypothetical protein K6B28_12900 [Lachnospiraceae bacterium]|nr:hypothetical protein [Lachnospiraceae bacterium]
MAVYIAICDDHIADRKQLERLFEREHSKRESEGETVYIDSFGSSEALMQTPYRYDLFLLDIEEYKDGDPFFVARKIQELGIETRIFMACGNTDYKALPNRPKGLSYINKPLYKDDVSGLVDLAFENSASKTPLIEIRCKDNTVFTPYDNFISASSKKGSYQTEVHLLDKRVLICTEKLEQFCASLLTCPSFFLCSRNALVNLDHISLVKPGSLTTCDGLKFSFPLTRYSALKKYMKARESKNS